MWRDFFNSVRLFAVKATRKLLERDGVLAMPRCKSDE
jgi:hypothetical protein